MTMTLACGTYFQLCVTIVVVERMVVAASPNDSHARLAFPKKSVEHVAYEEVDRRAVFLFFQEIIINSVTIFLNFKSYFLLF